MMFISQDVYATSLFQFLSQERELAMKLHKVSFYSLCCASLLASHNPLIAAFAPKLQLVVLQITWHKQALGTLEAALPRLDREMGKWSINDYFFLCGPIHFIPPSLSSLPLLSPSSSPLSLSLSSILLPLCLPDNTADRPTFGFPLEEHLKITGNTISAVIEECCAAIREKWMDIEGIFRLAGSASKLKLLKVVFIEHNSIFHHLPNTSTRYTTWLYSCCRGSHFTLLCF